MQSLCSQTPAPLLAVRGPLASPLEMGAHAALGTALDASALASLLPAKQPNNVLQHVEHALSGMPMDEGLTAFHGRLQHYLIEMSTTGDEERLGHVRDAFIATNRCFFDARLQKLSAAIRQDPQAFPNMKVHHFFQPKGLSEILQMGIASPDAVMELADALAGVYARRYRMYAISAFKFGATSFFVSFYTAYVTMGELPSPFSLACIATLTLCASGIVFSFPFVQRDREQMQDYRALVAPTEIAFSDPEQDLSDIKA